MSYRSNTFQELKVFLYFTPDAYNLQGKSFDKKTTFEIKPNTGLSSRQLIIRSAKIQHRSNQAFLFKYQLPFIPSRVSECNQCDFVFNRKSVAPSSNVIGLKTQYFLLIRFLSCNRTVWSRKVYINRTNQSQLKLHFKWTSNKLQCNHHGNDNEVSEAEILNKITKWRYRGRTILLITPMVIYRLLVTHWF